MSDLLRPYRHACICTLNEMRQRVAYGAEDIRKIIPHRAPFLFLDAIHGLDLESQAIVGARRIQESDPVLHGHFPGCPVYPGVLILETLGQLGAALMYFLERADTRIAADAKPVHVRLTKILGADFREPVRPGDTVTLVGRRIIWDGLCARFIGQALVGTKIACVAAAEFLLV